MEFIIFRIPETSETWIFWIFRKIRFSGFQENPDIRFSGHPEKPEIRIFWISEESGNPDFPHVIGNSENRVFRTSGHLDCLNSTWFAFSEKNYYSPIPLSGEGISTLAKGGPFLWKHREKQQNGNWCWGLLDTERWRYGQCNENGGRRDVLGNLSPNGIRIIEIFEQILAFKPTHK